MTQPTERNYNDPPDPCHVWQYRLEITETISCLLQLHRHCVGVELDNIKKTLNSYEYPSGIHNFLDSEFARREKLIETTTLVNSFASSRPDAAIALPSLDFQNAHSSGLVYAARLIK